MMEKIGIEPIIFLFTEIGRYGRFVDIYKYEDLAEYDRLTGPSGMRKLRIIIAVLVKL